MVYKNVNNLPHDVIILTETWLNFSILDSELFDASYQIFRRDRHDEEDSNVVGGGILFAIKTSLTCYLIDDFRATGVEALCIKIKLESGHLFIISAYIPPSSNNDAYEKLNDCIENIYELMEPEDEILIVGDFNLPNLNWTKIDDDNFHVPINASSLNELTCIDGMSSCGLSQFNGLRNRFGKILDLVFFADTINNEIAVLPATVKLIDEDRHHPALDISLGLNMSSPYNNNNNNKLEFDFSKCNFVDLFDMLITVNWNQLFCNCNIDDMCNNFYRTLFNCFYETIPLKRTRCASNAPPWFDTRIKNLKNKRNKAWVKYNITRTDDDYRTFLILKQLFTDYSNTLYDDYICKIEHDIKSNPDSFWNFVNSKRKTCGYPNSMSNNSSTSHDPKVIANMFANQFKEAFEESDFNNSSSFSSSSDSFTHLNAINFEISEDTVAQHILNLDECFTPGPDGVPSYILKKCASYLSYPLCVLFNASLKSSIFPVIWKSSFIIPIHKKGPKNKIMNYRPIAKLSVIPKLFESIVSNVLSFHCSSIICDSQHGFVKKRSTVTNLFNFVSFCLDVFEKRGQVDCVFTDFSKAFDKLCHNTLILKLYHLGFNNNFINWISSYLKNRRYSVLFRTESSIQFVVNSGVPQGSHLGPILFVLFINDLVSNLKNSSVLVYADDIKLFKSIKSSSDCLLLQEDLTIFREWCNKNRLVLNVDKCKTMSFTRKKFPFLYNYTFDSCPLCKVSMFSDLGIILDPKLSFNDHLNYIIKKANRVLGFIKRFGRDFRDPYVLKLLFISFVRPILEYGCVVWSPYYSIHVTRIEAIQKRFLRFCLRSLPWARENLLPPYSQRLALISLPSLTNHRKYIQFCFIVGIINGSISLPSVLSKLNFSFSRSSLRRQQPITQIFSRSNYGVCSPFNQLITIYNEFHFYLESVNDNIKCKKFKLMFFNNV